MLIYPFLEENSSVLKNPPGKRPKIGQDLQIPPGNLVKTAACHPGHFPVCWRHYGNKGGLPHDAPVPLCPRGGDDPLPLPALFPFRLRRGRCGHGARGGVESLFRRPRWGALCHFGGRRLFFGRRFLLYQCKTVGERRAFVPPALFLFPGDRGGRVDGALPPGPPGVGDGRGAECQRHHRPHRRGGGDAVSRGPQSPCRGRARHAPAPLDPGLCPGGGGAGLGGAAPGGL